MSNPLEFKATVMTELEDEHFYCQELSGSTLHEVLENIPESADTIVYPESKTVGIFMDHGYIFIDYYETLPEDIE